MSATTTRGVREERVVLPLGESTDGVARLGFDNGLARIDLRAGGNTDALLSAEFAGPLPVVWADGNNAHVEYPLGSRLFRRPQQSLVRINPAVPWAIDVHGGAAHLDADFSGVDLRSLTFHSGAAHVRLVLDRPAEVTTIRLTSVKDLNIQRSAGVPVRLEVTGAATKVRLDDRWLGAVGGGLVERTEPMDGAGYVVVLSGSADTVTVGTVS